VKAHGLVQAMRDKWARVAEPGFRDESPLVGNSLHTERRSKLDSIRAAASNNLRSL
jgi:hypothetical protein